MTVQRQRREKPRIERFTLADVPTAADRPTRVRKLSSEVCRFGTKLIGMKNADPLHEFASEEAEKGTPGVAIQAAASYARYGHAISVGLLVMLAITPWALLARHRMHSSNAAMPQAGYASRAAVVNTAPAVATTEHVGRQATVASSSPAAGAVARPERGSHAPGPVRSNRPMPVQRRDSAFGRPSIAPARGTAAAAATTSPRASSAVVSTSVAPMASLPDNDVVHVSELASLPSVIPDGNATDSSQAATEMRSTVGPRRVNVSADASDPDGDAMTFRWSAPAGRFADATAPQTEFTCPTMGGEVAVTIAVTDAHGALARDTITIRCDTK